jgi:hypothetical protein
MKKIIMAFAMITGSYCIACAQNMASNNHISAGDINLTPASLPVLETYVPQTVIDKLKNKYGSKLYDITTINVSAGNPLYVVRTEDNWVYTTQTVSESEI